MDGLSHISIATPRQDIRAQLSDGVLLAAPLHTSIADILRAHRQQNPSAYPSEPMGAIVDGKLRELSYTLKADAHITPVLLNSSDGGRIYRRSLVLLLVTAIDELFSGVQVSVRYAVPEGGYYCVPLNRPAFSPAELAQIDTHMRKIVQADAPITKRNVPIEDARDLFRQRNDADKIRLLEQRERDTLVLYQLRNWTDYFFGYMLPACGALHTFKLIHTSKDGFILQYPRSEGIENATEINPESKLTNIFQEADEWIQLLGVEDIGRLNAVIRNHRAQELILVTEALHEQRIAYIAGGIYARHKESGVRVVLIAGPSSSGKTTFSKRLAVQLLAHGITPFTLELDNYFVDRHLTPRDENGDYDFESLGALNIERFNTDLLELINGETVTLPKFDFKSGISSDGRSVKINPNCVIIIEGIHGLNPQLVPNIPQAWLHRVYVSALTQLNVDAHNRVPTTDVRLLRRIVRDARSRGYNAIDTLNRWGSVRRGEKRNIFPYQENADAMFNTALAYELAALRPMAEPLLLQVPPNTPPHIEANRLLSFLRWVQPLSTEQLNAIPDNSLLREFIGGSSLEHYHPSRLSE